MQPSAPTVIARHLLTAAFSSLSCGPLMNSLFCRGGWDWVALGVMCVLYLHIDVFWAEETDASALLLQVIVLSSVHSCIDNALDHGLRHWACRSGRVP
jgi:hypothetical protein